MDFLVSIELIHNAKLVQIVFFIFDLPQFWKELNKTKCVSFWPQKLTHNVSFWGQKYADPISRFLGPETDKKSLILGPEIVKMGQQYFWGQKLTQFLAPETDFMGERNLMNFSPFLLSFPLAPL
jgi:hypothetical protein